jgi:CHAT domain-containing protein
MAKGFGDQHQKKGHQKQKRAYAAFLEDLLQVSFMGMEHPIALKAFIQEYDWVFTKNLASYIQTCFKSELQRTHPQKLAQAKALLIERVSTYLLEYPGGNHEDNLEVAIAGYEVGISVLNQQKSPELWASITRTLASAYRKRIAGDKAENLEKALSYCQQALQVFTAQAFPESWAGVQNNLGLVYADRIRGDRADNLEKAIQCYEGALEIYTREAFPQEWGRLQYNMGIAYSRRIQGDKAGNQEKAISCYEAALPFRSRENFPHKWAQIQYNLGIIYSERLLGDPIENIETAIAYYEAALQVWNPYFFSTAVPSVQHYLEAAYQHRDDLYQSGKELNFLLLIFQTIQNNLGEALNPNPFNQGALDSLLAGNLDRLNEEFLNLFSSWSRVKLSTGTREEAIALAQSLIFFSRFMAQFPLGDRAINLEIAIQGYEIGYPILAELPPNDARELFFIDMSFNLMLTYQDRIRGDKAENIEKAIELGEKSLNIIQSHPISQRPKDLINFLLPAAIRSNLARAYKERILGNKSENIEQQIIYSKSALEFLKRETDPHKWALLQHNLGDAYQYRILGDPGENLEIAREYVKASLEVYTPDSFPGDWANSQNTLSTIYHERVRGDEAENKEKAIAYAEAALTVRTREQFPYAWAETQMNLGNFYRDRIRGNPAENLEKAIAAYEAALQVYTQATFPERWADSQINLGIAYASPKLASRDDNLERAIAAYEAALQVHTREVFPWKWAKIQKNLAIVYTEQNKTGNRKENSQKAITACQAASQVFTEQEFPDLWAKTQHTLATAYLTLGQIDEAISCFQSALKIYNPETFPQRSLAVGKTMAEVAARCQRWEDAIQGYQVAIEAVETSRIWTNSEFRRQEILTEHFDIYRQIVQCFLNMGQLDKALEYVERSRSKTLVDLMASNDLYAGGEVSPEVTQFLQQFEGIQQQIEQERRKPDTEEELELNRSKPGNSTSNRAALKAYNQRIAELEAEKLQIWENLRGLDPVLAGGIKVDAPNYAAMQQLIDKPSTAILNFYTTAQDTQIFVLKQNHLSLHTCHGQGLFTLQPWLNKHWLDPYLASGDPERTQDERQELKSLWHSQINSLLSELAERMRINELISEHLDGIEELIIVPHLLLQQIPLAALPIEDEKQIYLSDKFLIRYTPNCQILQFCTLRGEIAGNLAYGIVEDATDDLVFAGFEGENISQLFSIPANQRLIGSTQATRANYRKLAQTVQVLHSSHHAESRLDNPLESVLKLGDGSITLGELMTPGWRLPNLSDVFLSCCETGLGLPEITDDIFTLGTGFLCAGARSVVNTLWIVDDFATALFAMFYYQHRQAGKNRPEALQQAQIQLRTSKKEDLREIGTQAVAKRNEARQNKKKSQSDSAEYFLWDREYNKYAVVTGKINIIKNAAEEYPFAHPRFWAAFTCQGLR